MSIMPPGPDINPWASEIRNAAQEAVTVAAQQYIATVTGATRTLAYYLRAALAHGMTAAEISDATGLDCADILELADPLVAG